MSQKRRTPQKTIESPEIDLHVVHRVRVSHLTQDLKRWQRVSIITIQASRPRAHEESQFR